MHRNLFAPVSLLVLGLVGCRAQEESKALQNSVTRLEQKLSRLDESMRAQQAEQEAGKDAKAANDKAIAELKRALDEARAKAERAEAGAKQRVEDAMAKARNEDQGRQRALDEARARLADFERRFAEARGELDNRARDTERMRGEAERQVQEMRRALEQAQREAGELRQQMARQQGERRGDDGRMEALERLAAERREVEKLRAQVMADVARGKQQDPKPEGGKVEVAPERLKRLSDEMAKLRAENKRLEKALADAKQAMAGGKQADGDRFVFVDVDDDGLPDARAEARNAPDRRVTVMQLPEGTPPTKPTSKRIASRDGMFVLLDEGTPPPMPHAAAPKTMTLPLAGGGSLTIENEHCEVHIHVHGNAAPTTDGAVRTYRTIETAPTDKAGPTPPKTVRLRKGEDAEVVEVITAPQPQQETPPAAAPKAIRARRVGGEQPAETTPAEAKPPANAGGGKDAGKQPAAEPKKAAKTVGTRDAETVDEALLEYVLELLLGPV
jgi:hypothetical protein